MVGDTLQDVVGRVVVAVLAHCWVAVRRRRHFLFGPETHKHTETHKYTHIHTDTRLEVITARWRPGAPEVPPPDSRLLLAAAAAPLALLAHSAQLAQLLLYRQRPAGGAPVRTGTTTAPHHSITEGSQQLDARLRPCFPPVGTGGTAAKKIYKVQKLPALPAFSLVCVC